MSFNPEQETKTTLYHKLSKLTKILRIASLPKISIVQRQTSFVSIFDLRFTLDLLKIRRFPTITTPIVILQSTSSLPSRTSNSFAILFQLLCESHSDTVQKIGSKKEIKWNEEEEKEEEEEEDSFVTHRHRCRGYRESCQRRRQTSKSTRTGWTSCLPLG